MRQVTKAARQMAASQREIGLSQDSRATLERTDSYQDMMFPGWLPPALNVCSPSPPPTPKPGQLLVLAILSRAENHKAF